MWTILFPTNDVLQPRKHQETLMACLLFDPVFKTRMASLSAFTMLLESHSSVFLQVAEYKESSKCESFTTLSSSLGQILMQIHRGLISTEHKSNVLSVIFQFSQKEVHPTIRFEALQALRALLHNYPIVATICWEHLSANVHQLLQSSLPEVSGYEASENSWIDLGNTLGSANERCTTAAIKVLDECLRAASGFQGIDNLLECRLLDIQCLSESTRTKRVSSAPSYKLNMTGFSKSTLAGHPSGAMQWNMAIDKHLPLSLSHGSPMIRAAAVTCFAGMTSSVFFSLGNDKQKFVVYSIVHPAVNDKVPSVRAAACRAIGVIACFPRIFNSSEVSEDIVHAIKYNIHDPQISVRITSSWALANICDSLRHRAADLHPGDSSGHADSGFISLLFECALQLTKDGDKIKANAVRALGNLSRFVNCSYNYTMDHGLVECITAIALQRSPQSLEIHHRSETGDPGNPCQVIKSASLQFPHWPERMVQAFVSCVTTGNVKVQWNVCHALGNLFLNESLKLQDASWAPSVYSILLLLLRDSTNFKIRIHAAVALAVPGSRVDYGSSFSDIVQGLVHVLESIASERVLDPSNFKYRDTLEKQLVLTMLHVLGLASSKDDQSLKDFLIKKASFLEQWLSRLCSLLPQTSDQADPESSSANKQKTESTSHVLRKQMVLKATKSLSELYKGTNNTIMAQRFEKLADEFP
ncbi:hypothetical protein Taro_033931 [Colocasia esculenta]|uniref:DUF4042 domain-containing protein n=1 Tax=Colocasia esculenta TaxID=4460 RepID=A0A843W653_COLES|nr:hypothetical protein [Colocasia esculenta]